MGLKTAILFRIKGINGIKGIFKDFQRRIGESL